MQPKRKPDQEKLLERCLAAFVKTGTIDLSLDQLASSVGISKRMLVHYFGGRENIEEGAMARLEERLRAQFSPESFPAGASPKAVLTALWEQTTAPQARGVPGGSSKAQSHGQFRLETRHRRDCLVRRNLSHFRVRPLA